MKTFRRWIVAVAATAAASSAAQNFVVTVEVAGQAPTLVSGCQTIGSENEVIEQKVVDSKGNETILKTPGQLRWIDITCTRGLSDDLSLQLWRKKVEERRPDAIAPEVAVVLWDNTFQELARWTLTRAWPRSLRVSLDTTQGSPTETISLVYDSMVRVR